MSGIIKPVSKLNSFHIMQLKEEALFNSILVHYRQVIQLLKSDEDWILSLSRIEFLLRSLQEDIYLFIG